MAKKPTAKRELENPGDLSVSVAPAASKKSKAQPAASTNTKTRSAAKQVKPTNTSSATNEGSDADMPALLAAPASTVTTTQRPRPKVKAPPMPDPDDEPESKNDTTSEPSTTKPKKSKPTDTHPKDTPPPAPPATKAKKSKAPKELAIADVPTSELEVDQDAEPSLLASKKPNRSKKPSAIAEKVNKQATDQQNAKQAQVAKKAKKAQATVITETPEDTAAFLAKAKGESRLATDTPVVTSPKRKRLAGDRAKAMDQLVKSQVPSPSPSLVSVVSAATGASARTSSIAPDDSISQVDVPRRNHAAKPSLQVPSRHSTSRDVSPTAPPHLDPPASNFTSRHASSVAESTVEADEEYDEEFEASRVDIDAELEGILKPRNLGPAVAPPELPGPHFTARLTEEVLAQMAESGKDKSKAPRPKITNFLVQDREHLRLNIEYMEDLLVNIHAFPDDDTRWTFATLSNYWASKKLKRHYRLTRDSEHCRLLYSRISQVRGRLVSPTLSDGIRDNYDGLAWKPRPNANKVAVQNAIRARVTEMIQSGSFLAPDDKPLAYYQNPWFGHILKHSFWQASSSKGFARAHAAYFSGISYPMLALAVTATEKMLSVVAAGPSAAAASHRSATTAFSHKTYAPKFDTHLRTLARLHQSHGGQHLTSYLRGLYEELRGSNSPAISRGPAPRLAIPLAAFDNYAQAPDPPVSAKGRRQAPAISLTSLTPSAPDPGPRPTFDLPAVLADNTLTDAQKVQIINLIYTKSEEASSSLPSHSTSASRQFSGLWTEVSNDSDDSEVKARRAGALPDTGERANPATNPWESDADAEEGGVEEARDEGKGGGNKAKGDGNGESEPELDTDPASEDENVVLPEDQSMVVLDAGDGGSASDDDVAPIKPRELRFFAVDGSALPCSSDDDDGDSVGEGNSGAVAAPVDGDQTMVSVVSSDESES
ncbi:hypothetical protein BDV93DRAFT_513521 [Ceratobasidium sp. AG-I]|nr:hypothetical protein BDV93DRAFT_513521 [Ceratobasidium sp. AG-I]